VLGQFAPFLQTLDALPVIDNPKGELQELLQADSAEAPTYQTLNATGPEHDRVFECSVSHGGVELGRGSGKSKKEAESAAALAALTVLTEKKKAAESAARGKPK
jgi:ribonuclease III